MDVFGRDAGEQRVEVVNGLVARGLDDDAALLLAHFHGLVRREARGGEDGGGDADGGAVSPSADDGSHGGLVYPMYLLRYATGAPRAMAILRTADAARGAVERH